MIRPFAFGISMIIAVLVIVSPGQCAIISTLNPLFDTYVRQDVPASDYSWSGNNNAGRGSYTYGYGTVYRTFLKFDLTGIPDDATITDAALRMNVRAIGTNIGPGDMFTLSHVPYDAGLPNADTLNSWDPPGWFNWNSSETLTGLASLDAIEISSLGWKEWDLLASPNIWNYSSDLMENFLSLRVTGQEIGEKEYVGFWTRNATGTYAQYQPQLVIEYQVVPIPGAIFLMGSGLVGLALYRRKVTGAKS